jgi:5-oxoprolinase (ATP-hydrolysing) subunit A
MTTPFLNIDAGELADEPDALYAAAQAVSIACGGHAGDAASMARAIALCRAHGTRAGAHPSYPDRANFGRAAMDLPAATMHEAIAAQCAALSKVAKEAGVELVHVKPHGALYHAANRDPMLATALVAAARDWLGSQIAIMGPPTGALADAAQAAGLAFLREGFADRGLLPDGSLVPRGQPGALLHDPKLAAAQAERLSQSGQFDTLCVHGDSPGSLAIARAVRAALEQRRG